MRHVSDLSQCVPADAVAIWDADHLPLEQWLAMGRMGHREEFAALARERQERKSIQLKDVAGCDVDEGLAPAAYSGG